MTHGIRKIHNDFGIKVSDQYVRNIIYKNGLELYKRPKAPALTKKHLLQRKKFYDAHAGLPFDHYKNYIFSDESTFGLVGVEGGKYYYKEKKSKTPNKAVIQTKKFSGKKLMVFGFITSTGNFKIYRVDQWSSTFFGKRPLF